MNNNLLLLLILIIIVLLFNKYIILPRKIVYDTTCNNCIAWNHRDARPHCEKTCTNLGNRWKYNLKWKYSENKNDIVCGCVKL